jgi:adenosylcobinamide-GDP ribazoletransferase
VTGPEKGKRDHLRLADELLLCLGLLTCLPAGSAGIPADGWLRRACRWFPLVGALVGGLAAGILYLATLIGLPGEAAAILALGGMIVLTGAIHEDGLADVADGFAGGRTREDRLRIMRDSRIGTYGALALIVSVAIRWAAITALLRHGAGTAAVALVVAGAASRLTPVLLMRLLAPAREDGLGATAGRPEGMTVRIAVALSLLVLLLLPGPAAGLAVIIVVALAFASVAALARRRIGGHTGDVLGAGQQVTEMLVLLGLAASLP